MADIKNALATKATITVTLTSLANGSARESTVFNNSSLLYQDLLLRVVSKGSAAGNTSYIEVYAYGDLGDSGSYTDGATGSDAAFTAANIKNARLVGVVLMNGTTAVIAGPMSVAAAFGGVLPSRVGFIFKNSSGASLSSTGGDHVVEVQGVYSTVG